MARLDSAGSTTRHSSSRGSVSYTLEVFCYFNLAKRHASAINYNFCLLHIMHCTLFEVLPNSPCSYVTQNPESNLSMIRILLLSKSYNELYLFAQFGINVTNISSAQEWAPKDVLTAAYISISACKKSENGVNGLRTLHT